jgi:hypothetical protein
MSAFDPMKYKQTTEQQWQQAAEAWHRWSPLLSAWLGPATDEMLEMAGLEQESFGALHQMLSGLDDAGQKAAWDEISQELAAFEGPKGFEGPCEMVVGVK